MQADQLFTGGTVRTGVPGAAATSALAVAGGRVLALGRDAVASRGPQTEVTDLAGGALLPSFGDGHVHPLLGGLGLRGVPVREARSVDEILAAVAAWAAAHPDAEWVTGDAFDPTLADGGRFDARWLDQVIADRPVVLRTTDHHTMWVNSEALRRAGIDAGTPEPAAGQIVRRADGSPLGTLREWGAIGPVLDLLPAPGPAEQAAALAGVSALFAAAGITWVQDAWVDPDQVDAWLAAAAAGTLRFRANLAFRAEPTIWKDQLSEFAADRDRVSATAPDWLTARTVKFFADGVVEAGTAALLQPYDDCPHSHGIANWTPAELADAMTAADALGFQAHVHAIGDAGVRLALDAIAETARRNGPADRRPDHGARPAHRPGRPAPLRRPRRDREPRAAVGPARPADDRADPAPRRRRPRRPAVPDRQPAALRRPRLVRQRLAGHRLPAPARHRHRRDPADPGR